MATVTVLRTGGSSGTLSVDYSTTNVTAIAGQDYTSASGTLTFNSGETIKSFQIPIADDATTEPDETFTIALQTSSSLETLGAPSKLTVTIQDRTTIPTLSITSGSVIEGNTGTTTEVAFFVNLSAATSRAVSVNYTTTNFSAFGGVKCNNSEGIDYETNSGSLSFQPGTTTFTVRVKICGDTNAEANETFRVVLSNPSGATLVAFQGVGTIINDDALSLVLEESGPSANQAAALDAYLLIRDPFHIMRIPDWIEPGADPSTRVALFAQNLQLNPGEPPAAVIVRFVGTSGLILEVPAEDVRSTSNPDFTQVVVRLPNNLAAGTYTMTIRAHTRTSNGGTIRIVP